MKPKTCKYCKSKFVPNRPLEQVCSYQCAIELSKVKTKKKLEDDWKRQKSEIRENIKTLSDWQKDLQKEINLIVRLIDKGHPCISSGRNLGKSYDAGHLYSVGSNPQIRYHLFNIFAQSVHDNQWKSGNQLDFVVGIEKTFGVEIKDFCLSLKGLPTRKLSIEEIKEKIQITRGIIKWLKLQDRMFTNYERIAFRDTFNEKLGIYDPR